MVKANSLSAYSRLNRLKQKQKDLPRLPKEFGYDVCGQKASLEKYFITHQHLDHLPAKVGVKLVCAPPLLDVLEKKLKEVLGFYEVEEYRDFFETKHMFFNGVKFEPVKTYGYFVGSDIAVIPESIDAERFLCEYAVKGLIVIFFKQPRDHLEGCRIRSPLQLPENCWFADPSSWKRYAPNVLPKVVFSLADIQNFGEHIVNNPFKKLGVFVNKKP